MASNSETGHAKNVANFDKLLSACNGYGSKYNPSRKDLTIPELQILHDDSEAAVKSVKPAEDNFKKASNTRRGLFNPAKPFATRLIGALDATEATDATVDNARTINRKIQGTRATEKPAPPADGSAPKDGTSVSQQSFDLIIDHFDALITLITAEPTYNPNEQDLTATALQDFLKNLQVSNKAFKDAKTAYDNAIIARNKVLYTKKTGLVPIAGEVKSYVRSVYSASAPEYKQISGLQFRDFGDDK